MSSEFRTTSDTCCWRLGKKRDCTVYVEKTKALINAQLFCVFVLAFEKDRLSHDAAHIMTIRSPTVNRDY